MSELYEKIYSLCAERGIKPGKMCGDLGISRGNISDLKMGRIESLSADKLFKISGYFGVTVDYLLGAEAKKAPTPEDRRQFSDDDLMFALFGDTTDVDQSDLEDVRRYAAFIKERKQKK